MSLPAKQFFLSLLLSSFAMSQISAAEPPADQRDRYEARTFTDSTGGKLPYRLLQPKNLEAGKKYPIVLFLHGAGERGTDNFAQLAHGLNDFAANEIRAKYPAFVVAPQCPNEAQWVNVPWSADSHSMPEKPATSLQQSLDLITALAKEFPVDENRVYITGLSMGGYGTWDAIQRQPKRFAAAAPICGGGDPAFAQAISGIPLWAFHGDKDDAVKPERTRQMIAALKASGGTPKYTEYAGVGHNSWSATYSNPEFYAWLFAQKLGGEKK